MGDRVVVDDGKFWLPPKFLNDDEEDDVFMENPSFWLTNKDAFASLAADYPRSSVKSEMPCRLSSLPFHSNLSSPVESVFSSAETESDEEDFLARRRMAQATLHDVFTTSRSCSSMSALMKRLRASGSPQSTLCSSGMDCQCMKDSSMAPSPPATLDLLYAAADEISKMRISGHCCTNIKARETSCRRPCGIPPLSKPLANFDLRSQHSFSYHKPQQSNHQQVDHDIWGMHAGGFRTGKNQHPEKGRTSERAFCPLRSGSLHTLQAARSRQQQVGFGSPSPFGKPGTQRQCAGTGVFLPRQVDSLLHNRKKPGCPTVLLPARVVNALNSNLNCIGSRPNAATQYVSRGSGPRWLDSGCSRSTLRDDDGSDQMLAWVTQQAATNRDVQLPQEWTY